MRTVGIVICLGALSACVQAQRPQSVSALVPETPQVPVQPEPFDDTPASFVVRGPNFAPGESAIIRVCVSANGAIASTDVALSSGDKRYDDFALVWARQVKMRDTNQKTHEDGGKDQCGTVRVEIKNSPSPRVLSGPDALLG